MGEIIPFRENSSEKKFKNVKIVTNKRIKGNLKSSINKSCLNFKIVKKITDQELKIIYNELADMLTKINIKYYNDILPLYMNYVVNYCSTTKTPITKEVYIEQLNILGRYLLSFGNYKLEDSKIKEEQEKLTELMQRR